MKKLVISLAIFIAFTANVYANTYTYDTNTYTSQLETMDNLMEECNNNGISTDYERAAYTTMSIFKSFMDSDSVSNQERLEYNGKYLDSLYTDTIEKLEDYKAGTITSRPAINSFGGQDFNIRNKKLVDNDGNTYFSVGYGHYMNQSSINNISNFGMNNTAVEIGPWNIAKATDICNWRLEAGTGNSISIDKDILKMERNSGTSAFYQTVPVKRNTTYTVSARIKSDANSYTVFLGDGTDFKLIDNTWKEYTWQVSTGDSDFYNLRLKATQGVATSIYFDDITMTSGDANIVKNGDFAKGAGYAFTNEYDYIYNCLNYAQENGIAINVLLSPHYVPDFLKTIYPDAFKIDEIKITNSQNVDEGKMVNNFNFILSDKNMVEFYMEYYAFVAHMLKDYPALASIILANEPRFEAATSPDFYNPKFAEWLENKYKTEEEFKKVYGDAYNSFADVTMPQQISYYTPRTALDYDYICFNEDELAEFFSMAATAVRSETNKPLSIKSQNTLMFVDGINSLERLRWGNNVEKLNNSMDLAGCDNYCVYNWPATRADTMAWYDMLSSLTGKPVYNSEDHVVPDASNGYIGDEQVKYVRFNIWQGAMHHKVMSSLWTYNRQEGFDSLMDQADSTYVAAKTSLQLNENANVLSAFLDKEPEIAILYSPASKLYDTRSYGSAFLNAYKAALATGRKVGFVTEDNIANINKYKVLIVPAVKYTKASALEGIYSFINSTTKVILTGNCFEGDEHKLSLDTNLVANVKSAANTTNDIASELNSYFGSNIKLVDESGNAVTDVDWQYAIKGRKMYVNLCNIGDETKKVYVNYEGENVASVYNEFDDINTSEIQAEKNVPYLVSFSVSETGTENFELVELTDNSLRVRNNTGEAATVTIRASLCAENGTVKGYISNKRKYNPDEEKEIKFGFSSKEETDSIIVTVIDSNNVSTELTTQ